MKNIMMTLAAQGTTINPVGEDTDKDLGGDIKNIITAIIGAIGIVCVVVIIIGGVNYMTSNGDSGKVKKGKDTMCVTSFIFPRGVTVNTFR